MFKFKQPIPLTKCKSFSTPYLRFVYSSFSLLPSFGLYFLLKEDYNSASTSALVGELASLVFTAIIIGEVMASKSARPITKVLWIVDFYYARSSQASPIT